MPESAMIYGAYQDRAYLARRLAEEDYIDRALQGLSDAQVDDVRERVAAKMPEWMARILRESDPRKNPFVRAELLAILPPLPALPEGG